jgi:acyl-CoA reductase-like NAD-dependent aldehyde dehydrogenase
MSTERILVHSSIAEAFQKVLAETVDRMYGSKDNTPTLVTETSANRNRALVADAIAKGARPLKIFNTSESAEQVATRMRPVVLTNMDKSMELYATESFGPSVSLLTFDTEDEAVELANDTEYGLSAAVFTENLRDAFRVADMLDSGAVHINSMTVHDEFSFPHGGVKQSGFGRFNGYHGLDEFLYCKTVSWRE